MMETKQLKEKAALALGGYLYLDRVWMHVFHTNKDATALVERLKFDCFRESGLELDMLLTISDALRMFEIINTL